MKFLNQGLQTLEHEQARQTHRRDRTHYHGRIRGWYSKYPKLFRVCNCMYFEAFTIYSSENTFDAFMLADVEIRQISFQLNSSLTDKDWISERLETCSLLVTA